MEIHPLQVRWNLCFLQSPGLGLKESQEPPEQGTGMGGGSLPYLVLDFSGQPVGRTPVEVSRGHEGGDSGEGR